MINKLIQENLEKNIPEKDVAILLSGGVDSLSVAFACQNIGKNITAYSFKIKDVDNYDYNMAKEVSKIFNWPFISYEIEKQNLKTDFFKLKELGCYKKTHYECMYPFLHLIPKIEQKYIAIGRNLFLHDVFGKGDLIQTNLYYKKILLFHWKDKVQLAFYYYY